MKRPQYESDIYPLWDIILDALVSRCQDTKAHETKLLTCSQYTVVHEGPIRTTYRIPDSLILHIDNTLSRKLFFWTEIKKLNVENWFDDEGRREAQSMMRQSMGQLNTQAQYVKSEFPFTVAHAFIVVGVYWRLVEYQSTEMSPYFDPGHQRKKAPKTRAVEQDIPEPDPDMHTRFTYRSNMECLFDMTQMNPMDFKNAAGINNGSICSHINPSLLEAFRFILSYHDSVRNSM